MIPSGFLLLFRDPLRHLFWWYAWKFSKHSYVCSIRASSRNGYDLCSHFFQGCFLMFFSLIVQDFFEDSVSNSFRNYPKSIFWHFQIIISINSLLEFFSGFPSSSRYSIIPFIQKKIVILRDFEKKKMGSYLHLEKKNKLIFIFIHLMIYNPLKTSFTFFQRFLKKARDPSEIYWEKIDKKSFANISRPHPEITQAIFFLRQLLPEFLLRFLSFFLL